ncbi:MAG: beta-propeller fold lactonase family protein, partial [Chloroflexota bacterium]
MTIQTVYVTLQGDDKISIFSLDSETAGLTHREDFAIAGGPAPFAISSDESNAYVGLRDDFKIASLSVDRATRSLSLEGTVDLESDPCMISVDNNDNFLLSAYYGAGHIAVHGIDDSGKLIQEPIEWISTRQRAHCAITDASNSYTFLPHVDDSNSIYQYKFDSNTGELTPNDPPAIEPPAGNGPRHYVYHPNGEYVYFDNEQGCSVTAYSFDKLSGTLKPIHTVSTLPDGW